MGDEEAGDLVASVRNEEDVDVTDPVVVVVVVVVDVDDDDDHHPLHDDEYQHTDRCVAWVVDRVWEVARPE